MDDKYKFMEKLMKDIYDALDPLRFGEVDKVHPVSSLNEYQVFHPLSSIHQLKKFGNIQDVTCFIEIETEKHSDFICKSKATLSQSTSNNSTSTHSVS